VSKRVSPTEEVACEVDELFGSGRDLAAILEDVARVSVRLMLQSALEAEVDAFLGRGRSQRRDPNGSAGRRNGWQPPTTVHTTMGAVELQRPKLRGGAGGWPVRGGGGAGQGADAATAAAGQAVFVGGNLVWLLSCMTSSGAFFFVAVSLQTTLGYRPLVAGLALLPLYVW
jgi:hypothetical protein